MTVKPKLALPAGVLVFVACLAMAACLSSATQPARCETTGDEESQPEEVAPPVGTVSEDIFFAAGDLSVTGVIKKPEGAGPHPAIIFVHDGGAVGSEANGEAGRYAAIWERFLRQGYACVAWDAPGCGASKGSYDSERLFHHRADEVVAGIGFLKKRSDIDGSRIGLWGAGQAGYVMLIVAARKVDIEFVIAVGCPGEHSVLQGAYLIESQLLREGLSGEESSYYYDCYVGREYAQTYEEYLKYAEPLSKQPFVRDVLKWGNVLPREKFKPRQPASPALLDPAEYLEKITCPVLVIFGEKDTNLDVKQGVETYYRFLTRARNKDFDIVVIAGGDHSLFQTETGSIREQMAKIQAGEQKYVPEYLDVMEDWVRRFNVEMKK
ncbi:MAG: alpha/beta fold hydrolase [Candidatus Eiseniibacteriota bacterium]|nr:MAG: alpha/beta fold hydrolase [Candidatus Eisenbacteria bacterium]